MLCCVILFVHSSSLEILYEYLCLSGSLFTRTLGNFIPQIG